MLSILSANATANDQLLGEQNDLSDNPSRSLIEKTITLFDMSSTSPALVNDEQIIEFIEKNSEEIDLNLEIDEYFKQTVLFPSCQRRRKDLVDYLITKNADVKHQDEFGFSSLMTSAEKNYAEIMLSLLARRGDIIEDQDEDGNTALTFAARTDSRDALLILINIGADVQSALKDELVSQETKKFITKTKRNYLWLRVRKVIFNFWSSLTRSSRKIIDIEVDSDPENEDKSTFKLSRQAQPNKH